jgi:hypothetical protein
VHDSCIVFDERFRRADAVVRETTRRCSLRTTGASLCACLSSLPSRAGDPILAVERPSSVCARLRGDASGVGCQVCHTDELRHILVFRSTHSDREHHRSGHTQRGQGIPCDGVAKRLLCRCGFLACGHATPSHNR